MQGFIMELQTSLVYFINDGVLAGKAPTTLKAYQYSISSLFDYTKMQFLPQVVETLNEELLAQFMVHGIKIRKWNKYTHWTMYKNLHVYFNWCVKKSLLTKNPLDSIEKPKMPRQPPKSLNEKEVKILLQTVANLPYKFHFTKFRNKALICCLIFTGLRKSEIVNLRYTDVDLINGFITVEHGKGDKRREIPIEEKTLKPILIEYDEYRSRLCKTSEWFFNGTFGGRGINDNKLAISTIDRLFRHISKLCNKHITCHKLRHTFATLLLEQTGDIYTLKELMGHSNISTTCIYLSSTRKKKIEVINKLSINTE